MKNLRWIPALLFLFGGLVPPILSAPPNKSDAKENPEICVLYFSQIGCSHCAITDPWLFKKVLPQNDRLVVVEYELAMERENARMLLAVKEQYDASLYVPQILFGKGDRIVGDRPIVEKLQERLQGSPSACPLLDGLHPARSLPFSTLPYAPKIWRKNRVLFRAEGEKNSGSMDESLRTLLFAEDPESVLHGIPHRRISPADIPYSGGEMKFQKAIQAGGWILEWNP